MKLAIIDVGCGNIGSVGIAFERLGLQPVITSDATEIASADRIVLPGVGAAGFAMEQIEARGLKEPLRALTQPMLGICLGMQLLFELSEEGCDGSLVRPGDEPADAPVACLGLIPGHVRKLDPKPGMPVPHMGWSKLTVRDDNLGLRNGDYVYFAHSYACDDGPDSVAVADYGRPIPAAVRRGNFSGAQFHPERSGEAGARFLESFLKQ